MNERRPDPEAILTQIRLERSEHHQRGRLKVFFGANAGVGKTYAMLLEARERQREGVDVVVGYEETHGRRETARLLEGLEVLPRRELTYRGIRVREFDLDRALERHPQLILVDELAHTNAEGSRHVKRWQDVEEVLNAGIDVYTTVNVQHLESLNDLVSRITGVVVRETVPDSILEGSDIELIDTPPDELLQRLADGKVYQDDAAARASQNFFTRPNLTALRQLALRRVAEQVDSEMQVYRRARAVKETWPVAERVLVGVGPSPSSRRLVRATKRMADRLGAEWIALFVETPGYAHWPEADQARVWDTLRLAEQMGGTTATVSGADPAAEVADYARIHNVSKLIIGKSAQPRWRDLLFGSKVDELIRRSGDIDIYVISGDPDGEDVSSHPRITRRGRATAPYVWTALVVGFLTVVGSLPFGRVGQTDLAMLYLLGIVAVSVRFGRGPALVASVLSVGAFDFFYVSPYHTFAVSDARYLITFLAMLTTGVVTSVLTTRLKEQGELSRHRERRTAALYALGADLVHATDSDQALDVGARHIEEVFSARVSMFRLDERGELLLRPDRRGGSLPDSRETGIAEWVYLNGRPAGTGTDTLPGARGLYIPLLGSEATVGVLGVFSAGSERFAQPEQLHFLEAFASQLAVAVERAQLAEQAAITRQREEMDRLRSQFVANAAHDLRAPLASLEITANRLRDRTGAILERDDARLLQAIDDDVESLRQLAASLLDLSNLEAGRADLQANPIDVADLARKCLTSLDAAARAKRIVVETDLPGDLPRVHADAARLGQVLSCLLANALRATPPDGTLVLSADAIGRFVQISVVDGGPGIPLEEQARVFDSYARTDANRESGGSGLDLSIAREIVRAHGGTIWVDSGPGPGSVFSFTVPIAP